MTLKKLFDLRGKRALVTGATGHLGRVICETLAELGAELILMDITASKILKLQSQLRNCWKTRSIVIPCDLEFENQRAQAIHKIKSGRRGLDILINNAALVGSSKLSGWAVPFEKQSLITWRRALEVNLTAPFHLAQAFAPELYAAENGIIINITSIYGEIGPDWDLYKGTSLGNPAAYGASKGGLNQLTRWLATTMAPRVRVNGVAPGGISRNQPVKFVKKYIKKVPLKKMANENDFRGIIAFLASNMSSHLTGQIIRVDGGLSLK